MKCCKSKSEKLQCTVPHWNRVFQKYLCSSKNFMSDEQCGEKCNCCTFFVDRSKNNKKEQKILWRCWWLEVRKKQIKVSSRINRENVLLISLERGEAGRRREESSARVHVCAFTLSIVCQSRSTSVQHDSRTAAHPPSVLTCPACQWNNSAFFSD